jgi:hypothetical protein
LHPVVSDLRLAVRRARKRPGFTIVALLSLTLGIGANTAVFSLVNAILLRRAPIPHPEQIAEVYQRQNDFPYSSFSYPDYVDFRRATATTFSQVSISLFTMAAYDVGDHVESLMGELVNGDYFPLLGLRPAVGRLLGPSDDVAPGAHPVVVLSHDYWQRAFGGDPKVVGRLMRLAGHQYTIVGVALALSVLGVYGIVGYAVARRTREAGIRLAVGAQPRAIVALLMREGMTLVVVGAVLGVLLGFGSAEVLRSLLYGVGSSDPITFIAAPVILIVVGALAAFLPARRAGRVDPAGVLRAE